MLKTGNRDPALEMIDVGMSIQERRRLRGSQGTTERKEMKGIGMKAGSGETLEMTDVDMTGAKAGGWRRQDKKSHEKIDDSNSIDDSSLSLLGPSSSQYHASTDFNQPQAQALLQAPLQTRPDLSSPSRSQVRVAGELQGQQSLLPLR